MNDEFLKAGRFAIVVFLIAVSFSSLLGQINYPLSDTRLSSDDFSSSLDLKKVGNQEMTESHRLTKYPSLSEAFSLSKKENTSGFSQPKAYAYCDLAFFCKIEVQIEKAAKIPFKFRLGDVRYVDYLEQKVDSPK